MGRSRQTGISLGDYVVKSGYGMRKRGNRVKWKKRDSIRKGPRLKKRPQSKRAMRKMRTLKQLMVAREIEAIDLQQEQQSKKNLAAVACAKENQYGNSVMRDVVNVLESPTPMPVPDENQFRKRILTDVMSTLFPPTSVKDTKGDEAEAGQQLDDLDKLSVSRMVYNAIFWKARREEFAYAPTYWFVPAEGAAECFVTPRVITILLEEIITATVPLEQHLRVMVLLAVHTKLPWLEHTLLRSLFEWSAAYAQQQKQQQKLLAGTGTAGEDSSGQTHGLVQLWSALVNRLVGQKQKSATEEQQQQPRPNGGDGPVPPPFTDPAALLVRALIVFVRSAKMLPFHEEALTNGARLLAQSRPALGQEILSVVLRRWPQRDSKKELTCVRFLGVLLSTLPPEAAFGANQVQLLKRLPQLLQSPQAQVAHQAMQMIGNNMFIFLRYVVANEDLLSSVTKALYTAKSHWKPQVRELSEKLFDRALDYA